MNAESRHPALSFLVPVRNDASRLRRCLESIKASADGVPIEVLVADNGSTDGSGATALELGAKVFGITDGPVSRLRNELARQANSLLLAFVDADQELAPGWVQAAIAVMSDQSILAVGDQYHAPKPGTWVQRTYDLLRSRGAGLRDVEWLPSGNLVVRKTAFEAIGGFDTTLDTCEDVDICQRLRKAGGRVVAAAALFSTHHGDPQTLKAVFLGELWRGKDNLRITLRSPMTFRSVVGLSLSILGLVAWLSIASGSILLLAKGTPVLLAIGGVALLLSVGPQWVVLLSRRRPEQRGLTSVLATLALSFVYGTARSLAPAARGGHGIRRKR